MLMTLFVSSETKTSAPKERRPQMTDPINRTLSTDTLETAYRHFNATLFEGTLPECVLTAVARTRSAGHVANSRWPNGTAGGIDAIHRNPTLFRDQGERAVLATLVHERVHGLQEHTGKPSRNGDHNTEWVGRMRAIDLEPCSLDNANGTGQRVTHAIIAGGKFAAAYDALATRADWHGLTLTRIDEATARTGGKAPTDPAGTAPTPRRTPGKVKSASPCGRVNAWGKPGLELATRIGTDWVALEAQ